MEKGGNKLEQKGFQYLEKGRWDKLQTINLSRLVLIEVSPMEETKVADCFSRLTGVSYQKLSYVQSK